MTIREVILKSTDYLAKRGVDSPRLQSELLLAHILCTQRLKLYLDFERKLTDAELEQTRALVKRRGERIPLQHLLGATSFCGFEIRVTPDVLIPRPETEFLAEMAWSFLNQSRAGRSAPAVLDFGTGSGCLAIVIALKCLPAEVHALDVSEKSLVIARSNAASHGLADRIRFHAGSDFEALPPGMEFDLIISNPPYIPTSEIGSLQPEVRDYDPRLALDGGPDGLQFYRLLAAQAGSFLKPHGRIMVELGDGQSAAVGKIFTEHKYVVEAVVPDYSSRPRILTARLTGENSKH